MRSVARAAPCRAGRQRPSRRPPRECARVRGFGRPGSRVRARERSIQGTHRTRPRGGSRGSCWTSRSRSNAVINERNARAAGKRASPLRPLSRNRGAAFGPAKSKSAKRETVAGKRAGGESRSRLTKPMKKKYLDRCCFRTPRRAETRASTRRPFRDVGRSVRAPER